LPDERSVAAGRRALDVARRTRPEDTLVVLLSGGASALMAVPAGDLTLEDKRIAVNALLKAGADITALNTIRKHLSAVKGGRLAAAATASTVCLAISDVVGDDLSVIGSGPTVPDPSTYRDAWNHVERFGVESLLTDAAKDYLRAGLGGRIAETPEPGDPRLARAVTRVIGGRFDAMKGASDAARSLGYEVIVTDDPIIGDARTMGPVVLERARTLAAGKPRPSPCWRAARPPSRWWGRSKAAGIRSSRSQSRERWPPNPQCWRWGVSGRTESMVPPTQPARTSTRPPCAGQPARARPRHVSLRQQCLRFFQQLGDLIITGPSTTNVGDIQIVLFH
jgi:hydroxypyruvate reductase